jgi:hypothetical protein
VYTCKLSHIFWGYSLHVIKEIPVNVRFSTELEDKFSLFSTIVYSIANISNLSGRYIIISNMKFVEEKNMQKAIKS